MSGYKRLKEDPADSGSESSQSGHESPRQGGSHPPIVTVSEISDCTSSASSKALITTPNSLSVSAEGSSVSSGSRFLNLLRKRSPSKSPSPTSKSPSPTSKSPSPKRPYVDFRKDLLEVGKGLFKLSPTKQDDEEDLVSYESEHESKPHESSYRMPAEHMNYTTYPDDEVDGDTDNYTDVKMKLRTPSLTTLSSVEGSEAAEGEFAESLPTEDTEKQIEKKKDEDSPPNE